MLDNPGSSLRGLVPNYSYQCLNRSSQAQACLLLSVCLALWDSNGACISPGSHSTLFPYFSFSFSDSVYISLCVGVSQSVSLCVHTSKCIWTTFFLKEGFVYFLICALQETKHKRARTKSPSHKQLSSVCRSRSCRCTYTWVMEIIQYVPCFPTLWIFTN